MIKHFLLSILLLVCIHTFAQKNNQITLYQNWEFRKFGDTTNWMPAQVPGCVHTDLIANKIIPDPFYGVNEQLVQWVEDEDWEYRTLFELKSSFLKSDFITLNFEGLDTYADVYLNDSLIVSADNMFIGYSFNAKRLLKKGSNKLYIHFYSPVAKAKQLQALYGVTLPGEERVFIRKAQYQFGWDWGPRLLTSGIWKPITINAANSINVKKCNVNFIDNGLDSIGINVDLLLQAYQKTDYTITLSEITTDQILIVKNYTDDFPTTSNFNANFKVDKRWFPNGLGEQPLYQFEITISKHSKIIYSNIITTGFSNIKLVQQKDTKGESFYFTVNGKKVFAKGANLIPLNSFSAQATHEHYRKIVTEAKNMHMNMLRIWGGGIYEADYLYNLCDSMGIMIWQDFMFACAMYPNNPTWENEFTFQINRLQHHPSIALWCGNNENDEGWKNWGWQKQYNYTKDDSAYIANTNYKLFNLTIPEALITGIGQSNYHPSSPTHGWGRKESLTIGDAHYWGVWWGKQPFSVYNEKVPRFMSEYGFQGMPAYSSFKQFIPDSELYLTSPSVKNHQKHPVGYETIQQYMDSAYKTPTTFDNYIYVSQQLQADGMQTAIEAHRRNKPYCMGTLFWQMNDCWPVTSWSVVDYYFNRKASYYAVKRAYKDVLISVIEENGYLNTWFVNDTQQAIDAKLYYVLTTTTGKIISSDTVPVTLGADTSQLFTSIKTSYFLGNNTPGNCVLYLSLSMGDSLLTEQYHIFSQPKNLILATPNVQIKINEASNTITVSTDKYVHGLYLYTVENELLLSDNCFNLLPYSSKEISLQQIAPGNLTETIQFKCLNTLYKN